MLSSIHPLGERSRNNRWIITVTSFAVGSIASGAMIGSVLGILGSRLDAPATIGFAVAALAALLDLMRIRPLGPSRQVNERWIEHFRGTVYGFGFGAQLGAGIATYVVTWTVYALFVLEFSSGSGMLGAVIGATFGLGRVMLLVGTAGVDRPSKLTSLHVHLAELAKPVHVGTAASVLSVAAISLIGI